ncbi:MAG: hypothetical protein ACE15B_22860 [Bryobacteraceae bacterium]
MWRFIGIAAAVLALALFALQMFIHVDAALAGREAARRFGGDRVMALAQAVGCDSCPLKQRNHAVWALGEIGDRRALEALRKHYTGAKCDHSTRLCQYELDKAIRKIERTWGVLAYGARPK